MNKRIAGGKYELLRMLGKGAFAEVYLAVDTRGQYHACKVSENCRLLMREAKLQRAVRHELFPAYEDHGIEGGMGWLMMEYIRGENLEQIIGREGCFTSEETAKIGKRLANGVRYLHERNPPILFLDIKPANIMLGAEGSIKLIDFGCACPEGENEGIAGTVCYGAPEQFESGSSPGITADIYGLGKTLREMAGKNCDKRLSRVILSCTGTFPEERLPDMRWVEELLAVCGEKGRPGKFNSLQKAILSGKIRVLKNIWEYGYENA